MSKPAAGRPDPDLTVSNTGRGLFRLTRFVLFLLQLLSVPGSATAQSPALEDLRQSLERVSQNEVERKDIPSISLALVTADGVAFEFHTGRQAPGRRVAVGPRTVFRVGSVSKMFTALATVLAAEDRVVDLDGPVSAYLPEVAAIEGGSGITLRHLLSHRAGLVREPPVGFYLDPTEPSLAETCASMSGTKLVHPVGARIKYSNAGYGLAGEALARVHGTSFEEVIRTRILNPLEMTSSWFVRTEVPEGRLAHAEMWKADGSRFDPPLFDFGMSPAGFLYTTVSDLARFMRMLLDQGGELIAPDALHAMWLPQSEGYNPDWNRPCTGSCTRGAMEVGLAADLLRPFEGYTRVRHGGGVYGYATEFAMLPEVGVGVITIVTLDSMGQVARNLADAALRGFVAHLRGDTLPGISLTPDILERIGQEINDARARSAKEKGAVRGFFGDPNFGVEIVSEREDALEVVVEGVELVTLERTGPDTFIFPRFSSHDGETLSLERLPNGQVTHVSIGNGRGMRLGRVDIQRSLSTPTRGKREAEG